MGRPAKEELDLCKWRFYFKQIMESLNARKIKVGSLVTFAIVNPDSELLADTVEECLIMAYKAIESIKDGKDLFLKYDSAEDVIVFTHPVLS